MFLFYPLGMEQTSVTWPKCAEIVVLLHEPDGKRVSGQPFARHASPGIQSDKYLHLTVRSPHPSVHRNTNSELGRAVSGYLHALLPLSSHVSVVN